ncbi:reverse transcriptase domain-containing protein [Tanacetum coccineum]
MAERTMEELLRVPMEGYGEAIVIPEINADHFEIKTNLLQLVQASPDVPNDVIKLMMFPYSLEGAARVWYDKEPPNSILTWKDLVTKFVNQFFPPSKTTHLKNEISYFTQKFEETFSEAWERFKEMLRACPHHGFTELTQIDTFYNGLNDNDQDSLNAAAGGNLLSKTTREALNIIENKSKVRYSRNKSNVSRMNMNSRESFSKTDERIDKLADQISTLVEIVSKKVVTPATVKAVEESCVTCGSAHAWYNCPNTDNNQSNVCAAAASTSGTLPSNTIPNPKCEMKAITTRSGVAYEGPSIPTNPSPKKIVERETKETTDKEKTNFQGSTAHIPPPVNPIPIPEPDVPKTLPKPNIPYPLRLNDQKFRKKASNQMEKIFQIFQDLRFDISFADALLLMPRFAPTIKNLLMNKEKLFELAKIPLNENYSAMLLKKLPEKLGDTGKFLIPCDFPRMDDSNVSNFDEPVLLNTYLFDEDECFDPGGKIDKIDAFMDAYNDSKEDVLEILHNTTHKLFPEMFFDHEPQGLKNKPDNDDLMTEDKVFNPGVMEKKFSPSYVRLSSKDRHYLFFTIFSPSGVRTPFLTLASTLFIFLLFSRWHLKVKWKFALPLVLALRTTKCGDRVKLCDSVTKNKALHGRHPMLIHLSSFLFLM